ncbi:MAG: zinc ribbon domain-containing protein [Intestinibacter sp.]|uniref:zinc ribbon domain-containing protein n=1 Tax=Intestinibacter sp. TaxID=1965304 RepID=UPI002A7F17FE|nr:zinc ribbon domain-containing protein [Intestinibacter sp.]MDY4573799.1 zinc ribbon domain-containing protein [Intestinibacter sp.]
MQVKNKEDVSQFADKFRNYSKKDGHQYRKLNNKKFVLRRKNKIYCPNCKSKNDLNSIYCKECGIMLESINKRNCDFKLENILSNINIKDSFKTAGFATLILYFLCVIVHQVLNLTLGDYASYISALDVLLLVNGGNLSAFTNAGSMGFGNYYSVNLQVSMLILILLPVLCMMISYKLFLKQKNTDELALIRQSLGAGIVYGVILSVLALLSKSSISLGGGFLSSGYSLVYGFGFGSVLLRGFLIGFLSILYIGIKKEYEQNNIYLGIFKYAVKTIVVGYIIVFALLLLGHFIGLTYIYEFGLGSYVSGVNIFVLISQLAAYIWSFANFNPITIGSQNLFLVNLFSSSLSIDFKLCLVAFVALSALILLISGIKLREKYKNATKKTVLIFSITYAIMMAVLSIFTSIEINGGSLLGYNLQMGMSVIFTAVISFLYSFIIAFVGFKLSDWN